ncbi:hypothetical protein VZT92_014555 [Zoarces viviparus]|uniref:ITPR-interacting domain-containing protein n=1 Tax=Zoarces viviparus TaxID=48416 RepID=A0AAW1F0Z3_ZOAVI
MSCGSQHRSFFPWRLKGARAKRTNLVASRVHWNQMDPPELITAQDQEAHGNWSQDSVRKWFTTTVTGEDAKREPACKAAEPRRRNSGSDDDLALGVEASLYGSQRVRTVPEFLRWSRSSPALSRWSSFSSATSGPSRPHSVMDILNLWNDDPEEVLLDLGFGCDEPDLSGRIPARFINHQSQARGINLQVFLEAQKNRLDLENPDVSNRFRQLEVLQQVTTAFSSLVRSSSPSPLRAPLGKALFPEAQERRRRMGILFRRASKKSLSQIHKHKTQDLTTPAATYSPCTAPESLQPPFNLGDKKVPSKRVKPGLLETGCLSPLAEEKGAGPDPQPQPNVAPLVAQEGALSHRPLTEGHPLTANTFLLKKKSIGQARESFEIEEIHSLDESCVTGSYTGGAEHLAQGVIRSNSCQSDSSGFLEEPFIPPLFKHASPGADLIKALSGLSGGSTDIQSNERPACPSPSSPHTPASPPLSSSLTSSSYSLDELEEMMLCLQQFCSVLSNMEEQLSEDQAAVYNALSDQDRETVRDVEELRRAVKQEAGELEMQLNELADHYDDNLKMKMHRLLDEQSLLCSQLKFFLHGSGPTSSSPAPNRTVATQCCLLPWINPAKEQRGPAFSWSTWNVDSLSQPAGSKCICEGPGCSPTKAEKLDMIGFLQRLKESLHHSVNTD